MNYILYEFNYYPNVFVTIVIIQFSHYMLLVPPKEGTIVTITFKTYEFYKLYPKLFVIYLLFEFFFKNNTFL
jgi:hypothetical protein